MTQDQKKMLGLAAAGLVIYLLTKKKRKGSIVVGDPYAGQFLDDQGNDITIRQPDGGADSAVITMPAGGGGGNSYLQFVGPFEVAYEKPAGGGLISGIC